MELWWANSARTVASSHTGCLLAVVGCLLLSGCRNSGRQMQSDLYQRELRLQEDEIYRLEDYIEEYQGIVSGYRCEVADLKRELAAARSAEPAPATLPAPSRSSRDTIDTGPSLLKTPEPSDLRPLPSETLPAGDEVAPPFNPAGAKDPGGAEAGAESLDVAPPFEGAGILEPLPARSADAPREPAPLRQVSALAAPRPINNTPPNPYPTADAGRQALSTADAEPTPELVGDPAIRVTAERGETTASVVALVSEIELGVLKDFVGEVSVMLTDPTADGRQRRVARWDFSPLEVREAHDIDAGHLALTIALPEATPRRQPLRLWVRLIDRDGKRRLQATEVAFVGAPPELADSDALTAQTSPRRLPATEALSGETKVVAQSDPNGWRSANTNAHERRYDNAVAPASYDQP
ncbi:hypothetical protein Pla108_32690 [Botrimarina colliarenosi]|uniref:Uncharacterized protein n=1 Tax=Botrimarina colliarenosi TaxID=2528001 RepID=A0A5C6AAV8_9BACT|nr:hypothetical protein [Botrimarina colliarenosi]TWT96181.1 hypothetical protein Pla108_32690 [Botrimarina colliarenosi]